MKILRNSKVILFLIIGLALLLRIINLSNWPASFNQDEALNGYESYSILQTAHDHRGNFLPIFFEGFSDLVDNRLPLFIYSSVPSVALFGLTKFAVRFPSAIFGVLTVLVCYFLAKELFKKESIALLASFFLAISPWHIFLSRIALEVITVPLFFTLTILFFLKGLREKKIFIPLAGVSLGLLFYTYHIAKLLVPLLGLFLLIYFFKEIKTKKKLVLLAFLIFLLISLPFIFVQLRDWQRIQGRFDQLSIFHFASWPFLLIFSLLTYLTPFFLLKHYSFFVLIFPLLGLFFLIFHKKIKKLFFFIFISLISLLPAILVLGNPHSNHPVALLPFLEILVAFGLVQFLSKYRQYFNLKAALLPLFVLFSLIIFAANLVFLKIDNYPYNFFGGFYTGIPQETINYLKNNQNKYNKIFITNKTPQPYIFVLFFLKYPPQQFQALKIKRTYLPDGSQMVNSFDKYYFCASSIPCDFSQTKALYIINKNSTAPIMGDKIYYEDFR